MAGSIAGFSNYYMMQLLYSTLHVLITFLSRGFTPLELCICVGEACTSLAMNYDVEIFLFSQMMADRYVVILTLIVRRDGVMCNLDYDFNVEFFVHFDYPSLLGLCNS